MGSHICTNDDNLDGQHQPEQVNGASILPNYFFQIKIQCVSVLIFYFSSFGFYPLGFLRDEDIMITMISFILLGEVRSVPKIMW